MDSITTSFSNYLIRLTRELGEIAQTLDGTGWAIVSGILLIFGWFFLKGSKIKSV